MMRLGGSKKISQIVSLIGTAAVVVMSLSSCGRTAPQIVVEPPSQNLGDQPPQVIELVYAVQNTGGEPLIIKRVSTSCDCTTASLDRTEIPAGEAALLTVRLDPVEDNLFGDVRRVIYLRSNDPDEPEVSVEFSVRIQKP